MRSSVIGARRLFQAYGGSRHALHLRRQALGELRGGQHQQVGPT
jgi:hypothetical protein